MLSQDRPRHTYEQKPRIYQQSIERHQTHNAEKIALSLLLAFGLALIAIICNFFYEFLETYRKEVNEALYVIAITFIVAIGLCFMAFVVYFVAMLWLRVDAKRADNAYKRAENEIKKQQLKAENINATLLDYQAEQIKDGLVYVSKQETEQGTIEFSSHSQLTSHASTATLPSPEQTEPIIKDSLLVDIEDCQRLLITGGSGTGKTSLLLYIAQKRALLGDVLILDSNAFIGKWGNYRTIGLGYKHQAIESELQALNEVFKHRFKDYSTAKVKERGFDLITIIFDEYHDTNQNIKNLGQLIKPLLSQGRKLSIDLIISSNSITAKNLGFEGEMDLIKNFEAIIRLEKINNERLIYCNFGRGEEIYNHCGVFNQFNDYQPQNINNSINEILNPENIKEQAIIDNYYQLKKDGDFSWNKLSKSVYGFTNGKKITELKEVLKAHNINES